MDDNVKRTARAPALLILASFIIVVAGMKAASSILVPFFLAVFIAVICAPPFSGCNGRACPSCRRLLSF